MAEADAAVAFMQTRQQAIARADAELNDAILAVAGLVPGTHGDEDWGREEVSAALRLSPTAAAVRIELSRTLATTLTATNEQLRRGLITLRHAAEIVKALEPLEGNELIWLVEARVLEAAATRTPAQLARFAAKEVMAADPQGADERHRRARARREVAFVPVPDGMVELHALLPADGAARLRATIDHLAGIRAAGDDRTIDQRRADALVRLGDTAFAPLAHTSTVTATGNTSHAPGAGHIGDDASCTGAAGCTGTASCTGAAGCTGTDPDKTAGCTGDGPSKTDSPASSGPARRAATPRIALIAPLATAIGAADLPGELIGYGPVPPTVVRELAAAGDWEKWLTDRGGAVASLGRTVYRPSARLAALVRATYPTCVFPTCGQPSYRCDLDHVIRWADGGCTSAENLVALCRRHHRMKDEGGWRLDRGTDGVCTWVSPAGRTYRVGPAQYVGPGLFDQTTTPGTGAESSSAAAPAGAEPLSAAPAAGTAASALHGRANPATATAGSSGTGAATRAAAATQAEAVGGATGWADEAPPF